MALITFVEIVEIESYLEDVSKLQEEVNDAENELNHEREREKGLCNYIRLYEAACTFCTLNEDLRRRKLEQEAEIIDLKNKKTSSAGSFNTSDLSR